MPGLYDLFPEGALTNLGFGANANQANPGMNQGVPAAPQQSQGVLGFPDANSAFFGIARGLAAAGSPDPIKAALAFSQNDREQADEQRRINDSKKPKVTPIAGGAFSLVTYPDGSTKMLKNDQVADFLGSQQEDKFQQALQKIVLGGKVQTEVAGAKQDQKDASEARPQLQQAQQMFDGWTKAKEVVEGQAAKSPWMSKVQGALPGISGFLGGDEVASNKFLQGLKVDETLLNTARTKGAISEKEMALFASPIPSLSDDREKVWKPYIEARIPVIQKLMQFQQEQIARGDGGSGKVTGGGKFVVPGLSEGASRYFNPK